MKFIFDREPVNKPVIGIYFLTVCFVGFDFYRVYGDYGNNGWNNVLYFILLDFRIGISNFKERC